MKQVLKALVPRPLKKKLLLLKYGGNNYECPCCCSTFSSLWPSGVPGMSLRPNTLCPQCNSLERHRLLWLYMKANPQLLSGKKRVLHIAPEPIFTRLLKSFTGVDYLSADLDPSLAMVGMDLTDIAYPDASFDVILCYHVLEHIPDDRQAMRELHRVLKPDGWAILQSPLETGREKTYEDFTIVTPEAREQAFKQRDHVRIYGRDYESRLVQAGFIVRKDNFASDMKLEVVARYGIDREEDIYFCTKSGPRS